MTATIIPPGPRGLSKSKILVARQCAKRLWLHTHRPELAVEGADQRLRLTAGTHFGDLARDLLGGGTVIEHAEDLDRAQDATRGLLQSAAPGTRLFEAALSHDGVLVRADALEHTPMGWILTEVKSSTTVEPYHLEDVAVQSYVLRRTGLALHETRIGVVDNRFVYRTPDDYRGLLRTEVVDEPVKPLLAQVDEWIARARETLAGAMPQITTGPHCKKPFDCPFISHCAGQEPPISPFPLTRLYRGGKTAKTLIAEGFTDLRDVPLERFSNAKHRQIAECVRSGQPFIDAELPRLLGALPYPRYYLDFETIQFAVPRWLGTRPYQQVPFQFFCHVESSPGEVEHREFLDLSGDSPIEGFVEALLAACGHHGPVVVYNQSFEAGCIKNLAAWRSGRAPQLLSLIARMFDLLPPIRAHYYHPDLQGSFSIKAVLPTLVPELRYDALEGVQHGGDAQSAYLESIDPATSATRREQIHVELTRYCSLDTEAMLRLIHAIFH